MKDVDKRLTDVVTLALSRSPVDFGIAYLGGLRTPSEQRELYLAGMSTKDGYNKKSKHQYGEALDFIPYIGRYLLPDKETEKYYFMIIGVIFAAASELGVKLRSGANWDGDKIWVNDQNFIDLGHIETKT